MLISEYIKMNWSGRNKQYYIDLGYEYTKMGDSFKVLVSDLPRYSCYYIDLKCDYCGKIFKKRYDHYINMNMNQNIVKDCCSDCSKHKLRESNLITYGIESTNQLEEVINKKKEKLRHSQEYIKNEFAKRELILISEYENSNIPVEFLCSKHIDKGSQYISYGHLYDGEGCKYCGREKISGKNHYNWNGGITSLNMYLRDRIREWVYLSLQNAGYSCLITGNKGVYLEVHHVNSFNILVKDTLSELHIKKRKASEMSEAELKKITDLFLEKHNEFGVVLDKKIHTLFHTLYGKKKNTPEQFEEYKTRLKNGEFNDFLEENNFKLII